MKTSATYRKCVLAILASLAVGASSALTYAADNDSLGGTPEHPAHGGTPEIPGFGGTPEKPSVHGGTPENAMVMDGGTPETPGADNGGTPEVWEKVNLPAADKLSAQDQKIIAQLIADHKMVCGAAASGGTPECQIEESAMPALLTLGLARLGDTSVISDSNGWD